MARNNIDVYSGETHTARSVTKKMGFLMNKKQLLFSVSKKDFIIQTFRAGGKGGQKQNKVESGVRIIHKDSNTAAESRNHRSQHQNKQEAFKRLTQSKKFKMWLKIESSKRLIGIKEWEKQIDKKIEESMKEENLKIEYFNKK